MRLITVNCGSSSIKLKVFDAEAGAAVAAAVVEEIGGRESRWRQQRRTATGMATVREERLAVADHREGFALIMGDRTRDGLVPDDAQLLGIGHRVVHGGERFRQPTLIGDEVTAAVRALASLAPLHNPYNLLGIEIARERFPHVPQVAVFDTAFHHTLAPHVYRYALPADAYQVYHVRRYGFHGTSHQYVAREAAAHLGKPLTQTNLITLHLGNGASVAAIQRGQCADTSMGFTPLEGLVMGSRCGDLDASIPFYLMRQSGMSAETMENMLNLQGGLTGVCGTNDMRDIQRRAAAGDQDAALALDMFCYRAKKYIGAYNAVVGTLDALVFTGGIGENSPIVRQRVCAGLGHLGISVDDHRNQQVSGAVAEMHSEGSPVRVLVVRTDEELEIARQTIDVITQARAAVPADGGARS